MHFRFASDFVVLKSLCMSCYYRNNNDQIDTVKALHLYSYAHCLGNLHTLSLLQHHATVWYGIAQYRLLYSICFANLLMTFNDKFNVDRCLGMCMHCYTAVKADRKDNSFVHPCHLWHLITGPRFRISTGVWDWVKGFEAKTLAPATQFSKHVTLTLSVCVRFSVVLTSTGSQCRSNWNVCTICNRYSWMSVLYLYHWLDSIHLGQNAHKEVLFGFVL